MPVVHFSTHQEVSAVMSQMPLDAARRILAQHTKTGWDLTVPDDLMGSIESVDVERAKLDALKALKTIELRGKCQAEIVGGFTSDALGALHTYPSTETDQRNLLGSVLAAILPGLPSDWTTPFWCADADGNWSFTDHTATQIQRVGTDAKAAVVDAQLKLDRLSAALAQADDKDEIYAIVW